MLLGVPSLWRLLGNSYAYSQRTPSLSYAVSPDAPFFSRDGVRMRHIRSLSQSK